MKIGKLGGIFAALIPLALILILPAPEGLSSQGFAGLLVMASTLILLITEAIPFSITSLLGMVFLIVFGAVEVPTQAFSGFSNPVVWFVLGSFGISFAISGTNLSKRMLTRLLQVFGRSTEMVILSIMVCSAICSSIMSNVAAVVLFLGASLNFLEIYKNDAEKRKAGRALMIALPFGAIAGGMMTPAGGSLNLLCLSWLEQLTGLTVPFVSWMVIGIPFAVVLLPIAWFIITKINKPAPLTREQIVEFTEEIKVKERFSFQERIVTVVIAGMILLWILGSWFPYFNVTVVTIVGLAIMFIPGFNIMTWKDLEREVSWPAIILLGAIVSIGNVLVSTGAISWLIAFFIPTTLNAPLILVLFVLAIAISIMNALIPSAPAVITVLAVPIVGLAAAAAVSPVMFIMALALQVCNVMLLPFDSVPVITYLRGYYTKFELARTSVWLQIIQAALVALWVPIIVGILGL